MKKLILISTIVASCGLVGGLGGCAAGGGIGFGPVYTVPVNYGPYYGYPYYYRHHGYYYRHGYYHRHYWRHY